MHPAIAYCPATRSPGASCGRNENACPQRLQKPSVRPGWPSLARPTGAPQAGLPQNRRSSGTGGAGIIPAAGSSAGRDAISTSPAPRRGRATLVTRWLVARDALDALAPDALAPDAFTPHVVQ